ncbi:MAG: hypothetical protein JJU28_01750 [Cyclobacteriaceae bacterium]|nr:hypothetical protein [Cyclobacteriaceae bacterium]
MTKPRLSGRRLCRNPDFGVGKSDHSHPTGFHQSDAGIRRIPMSIADGPPYKIDPDRVVAHGFSFTNNSKSGRPWFFDAAFQTLRVGRKKQQCALMLII